MPWLHENTVKLINYTLPSRGGRSGIEKTAVVRSLPTAWEDQVSIFYCCYPIYSVIRHSEDETYNYIIIEVEMNNSSW